MRTGRIVSEHPKRCRTALVYWQYSIWCHPCLIFLFFILISMWFQSVVQPGHAECCWHCEGTVLTKGFGGPGKICLVLCLPCPTPFPPQYLYSEILAEICAPLSALSHKAATWRWFNPCWMFSHLSSRHGEHWDRRWSYLAFCTRFHVTVPPFICSYASPTKITCGNLCATGGK